MKCFIICDCRYKNEFNESGKALYTYSFDFKGIPIVLPLIYKPIYVSTGNDSRRKSLYNTLAKKYELNPKIYSDFAEIPIPFGHACYTVHEALSKKDARELEHLLIEAIGRESNNTGPLKNIFKHRLPKNNQFRITKRFVQTLTGTYYSQMQKWIDKKLITVNEEGTFEIEELERFLKRTCDLSTLDKGHLIKLRKAYPEFKLDLPALES